jgi:hypothetical protein
MAIKPIIDIAINDEAFKRFLDLFNDYSAKLEDMPESWQKLDAAMGGAGDKMKDGAVGAKDALAMAAAQVGVIAEELHHATKAQHEFHQATASSGHAMKELSGHASALGHSIFGMGKWLLKFGAIGTGLGAIGAGFGLDDLASSALSRQKSARSLGLTPGQLASFQANAQQFMGTGALTGAASAQVNPQDAGQFATLGISPVMARNESATRLAFQELKAARDSWKQYKDAGIDPMASPQVRAAISLGLSQGDIRNASRAKLATINADERATRADAGQLGFSSRTAAEWTKLKIAMDKAGTTIETSLIKALAPLAPQLARMSVEAAKFIAAFVTGPEIKKLTGDVVDGLKDFSRFIRSPKFRQDMLQFETSIGQLAHETIAALRMLHLIPGAHTRSHKGPINPYHPGGGIFGPPAQPPDHSGSGIVRWMHNENRKRIEQLNAWSKKHLPLLPLSPVPQKWTIHNNPLDLMPGGKLEHFSTTKEGIQAGAALLKKYPLKHHADTLASIIPIWNGHGENDASYIANVARWTGLKPDAPIDMHDPRTVSKLVAAMSREEGTDRVNAKQALAALTQPTQQHPAVIAPQINVHPHKWLAQSGPAERKETTVLQPAPQQMPTAVIAAALAAHKRFVAADVHVDKQTDRYVPNAGLPDNVTRLIKALRNRAPVKPAHISISNATSARVAVSVNAVAH